VQSQGSPKRMPKILCYVRDRDLGKDELEKTKEINAFMFHYINNNFDTWDELFYEKNESEENENLFGYCATYGAWILVPLLKTIEITAQFASKRIFQGYNTRVVEATQGSNVSDICKEIFNKFPDAKVAFGWHYDHNNEMYEVSLRSRKDEVNVNVLANTYGGGGHASASGFRVSTKKYPCIEFLFD
jgi:nanoRNase/pAp phosphatase (c-di-AMP/oligoRNAs hydrolase)